MSDWGLDVTSWLPVSSLLHLPLKYATFGLENPILDTRISVRSSFVRNAYGTLPVF